MCGIIGRKSVLDGIKLDNKDSVFLELYRKQKQAIWFPEEINVQQDIPDFQHMADKERNLFCELIWYFTTTELLVQNVLGESFYPYIVSPRAKMAMTVQMFMEDIHSDFFEMILNTFQMDREALYSKAQSNPLLKAKQEFVAQAADAISVSNRVRIDPDTVEWKKAILNAILINNIIQEGTFFYSAFAMFFAMRETGRMKNVNNGIDLVMIDESFHLKLWIELILGILEENPDILHDATFVEHIRNTIIKGTELELAFLKQQLEQNIIFGVTFTEMEQYLKYVTDRRLEELGFPPYYAVQANPLKFLQKQDMMTLQNFFEITPNQYTNF